MFNLLDILTVVILLIPVALCSIGFFKTDKNAAKIVCAITAFVFAIAIPLLCVVRYSHLKPDYTAKYGIEVRQGTKNKCVKEDIDKWSSWVVDFWSNSDLQCSKTKSVNSLQGFLIICVDYYSINMLTRHVAGVQIGKSTIIGYNGTLKHTESLVKHEMSHFIFDSCEVPQGEKLHHDLFKKHKLGY